MPVNGQWELRVLSFIFNLSSFSLLVHYGLIADQTPVDSCWARSTILALASIQRLYLTPCPPIKRISFAFWASMERIINDRQTIRHQVNSVKALRNKQMYACSTMRKSILSVCVCVCLMCVSRWMLCVCVCAAAAASGGCSASLLNRFYLILGLKTQFSILQVHRQCSHRLAIKVYSFHSQC